jgi:hypothetical protein
MSAAIAQGYQPQGKYVINHDIMNCTAEGVVGNHLYSGRALGISETWDIVQLHPLLQPLYPAISSHYKNIGLPFSENIIWDIGLNHLSAHQGYEPSVFFFGPNEHHNWQDKRWAQSVEYINSKNNFMSLARELSIDIPYTECFDNITAIEDDDIDNFIYPCYLKAAISVSGVGIYRCEDNNEFRKAMALFETSVPVQVQEEIRSDTFLNMQYRIVNDTVVRLAASEQILDGFVHQGNRVPASHEPWKAVEDMAIWLLNNGMKGIFAFDVAVVQTDRGLRFPAIECNPRFNGASYPTIIAQKMGIDEWSAITLSTHYRDLDNIHCEDLEYDHTSGEGIIIVNWGTVLEGKLMVLLAGDKDRQEALAVELEARLC